MGSISGIKHQDELESLPFFGKKAAAVLIGKRGRNLDKKILRLTRVGYFLTLKKGLYTTNSYYEKVDKDLYSEYLANIMRFPSYLSLEYILSKEGIIPESVFSFTSITTKSTRAFGNYLGSFTYRSIKESLFNGYREKEWEDKIIRYATRAKALFDFLYLKKMFDIERDIYDLRLNLSEFTGRDWSEFKKYTVLSGSKKMALIFRALRS